MTYAIYYMYNIEHRDNTIDIPHLPLPIEQEGKLLLSRCSVDIYFHYISTVYTASMTTKSVLFMI